MTTSKTQNASRRRGPRKSPCNEKLRNLGDAPVPHEVYAALVTYTGRAVRSLRSGVRQSGVSVARRACRREWRRPPRDPSSDLSQPTLRKEHDDGRHLKYRPCVPAGGTARPGVSGSAARAASGVREHADVGRRRVRRRVRAVQPGAREPAQRLPCPRVRHPRRHGRAADPEAAARHLLLRMAAGAAQARRAGAHQRGRDLRPARGLDPPDGEARAVSGHHEPVQGPVSDMARELDAHVE